MATYALTQKAVVLRSEDDVAVAKTELQAGTVLEDGNQRIEVRQDVKPGHKVACVLESTIPKLSAADLGSTPGRAFTSSEHRSSATDRAPARS